MNDNKKYLVEVSIRPIAVRPTHEGVYQNRKRSDWIIERGEMILGGDRIRRLHRFQTGGESPMANLTENFFSV